MTTTGKLTEVAEELRDMADRIEAAARKGENRVAVIVRFAPDVLRKVDAAAEKRGVSRSSWVQLVASRAVESGEA